VSASSVSLVRVRYAETDQMGVAWHGSYFAWFEVGRTDLLRERGMTYRELERADVRLPVVDARAAYRRPALYDDVLQIHTRVAAHSGARISFEYDVRREDEPEPIATGFTAHVAVNGRGRPRRLPPDLVRLIA
jgi:acyl-CoA thioester hydrolase